MSPFPAEPLNTASSGSVSGKWSAPVQPTPEPDTGGEVEALAKVVKPWAFGPQAGTGPSTREAQDSARVAARAVLTSDWLADRLAEARAEALREIELEIRAAKTLDVTTKASICAVIRGRARDIEVARTAPLQDAEEVGE